MEPVQHVLLVIISMIKIPASNYQQDVQQALPLEHVLDAQLDGLLIRKEIVKNYQKDALKHHQKMEQDVQLVSPDII
jgi:hypothetical protein